MRVIKEFFFLNLSRFENIGIYFPIGVFLILLCAVACFSVFYLTYYKMYTRSLYKQLLRHNAINEESAKTLSEMRLDSSFAIRASLSRRNGQLTYIVKRAGEEDVSYEEYIDKEKKRENREEKIDFASARFYIPKERVDRAKRILESAEPSWVIAGILSALFIGLLVLSMFFAYDALAFINGLL